jgi:beta-glucosidase
MEPNRWRDFIAILTDSVETKRVSMERIDDAVRRIVTVKCEAGLFEKGPVDKKLLQTVGSETHRSLARRAVRQSIVLLKNEGALLPFRPSMRLVVAGAGATSLTRQAGGWTVGWQGAENKPFLGTTLFDAMKNQASDPELVTLSPTGEALTGESGKPDAAVLVMSENAYAEGRGDSATLDPSAEDIAALDKLVARGIPTVVVVYSGRPIMIEPHLGKARAWLAAWLPGSAGEGVADVLYGAYHPTGKLSHTWPRKISDIPLNLGDAKYDPLFRHGYGITF